MNKLASILRYALRIMSRKGTPLSLDHLVTALDLGIELEVTQEEVLEALQLLSHPPFDAITTQDGLYQLKVPLEELEQKVGILAQSLEVGAGLRKAQPSRRNMVSKPAASRESSVSFGRSAQLGVPDSIIPEIRRIHETTSSRACKQIAEVVLKMHEGHDFPEACNQVAGGWGVSYQTILDACVRRFQFASTSDFQQAVYDGTITERLRLHCAM